MENWLFWLAAGGMALGVAAVLILALRRAGSAVSGPAAFDLRVYTDQLADVDRDLARGVLAPDEAQRLRTEVSRRVLEADRALQAEAASGRTGGALWASALVVVVIGASGLAYLQLGAPGYPDLPLRERIAMSEELRLNRPSQAMAVTQRPALPAPAPVDPAFADLMDKLRAALRERPDDLTGLELLARNEAALGNLAAAEAAQRAILALKGDTATAEDHVGLAELMILQTGGYVSPEAEAALVAALQTDPGHPLARYYSGLMFSQIGRPDQTFRLWDALLRQGPPDAPWIAPVRAQIEDVAMRAGVSFSLPDAQPGPDAADLAAAADMTPEARTEMIRGMVGQLSDRLATEGGPVEDWARLITSLGVLGETDRAGMIYAESLERFKGLEAEQMFLREAAISAGLTP